MNVDEFPIEVRHLMLYRQQEDRGCKDWKQFQLSRTGGFVFDKTPEGHNFWNVVICRQEFDVFYAKYPKVKYSKGMPEEIIMLALDRRVEQGWPKNCRLGFTWTESPERWIFWNEIEKENYSVYYEKYGHPTKTNTSTPSYKGQLEGFPPEVVELMLQRQFEQTGKRDVSLFEKNKTLGKKVGAFTWKDTIEGHDFWDDVIEDKKFDVFYKKYPKEFNSHIKIKQNDKESTTNSTGIKVFKPVATITNGERRTGTRISGRSSKTTIGSGHLSYQAVIGY